MTTTTEAPTVEVGDFFVSSWGYDQTNITFFKVISVSPSGKSAMIQEWTNATTGSNGYHDQVVPGDGPRQERVWNADHTEQTTQDAPVKRRKVKDGYQGAPGFGWDYHWASKWGGTPASQTNSMYGH